MDTDRIIGSVDASWADNLDDRKSTTGTAFLYHGAIVAYETKKQAIVALSIIKAEYIALAQGSREAIVLQRIYTEIIDIIVTSILVRVNNQAAILHAKDLTDHAHMKHINI